MVKVREDRPLDVHGVLDTSSWISKICATAHIDDSARDPISRACDLAHGAEGKPSQLVTGWGEGYTTLSAGLEMAEILSDLQLDTDTLVAAVLYRSVREGKLELAEVHTQFGEAVSNLIEGVQRMASISAISNHSGDSVMGLEGEEQAENVRKMLVAMVDDVRIALIKLAERTCAIRAVKKAPSDKRKKVASRPRGR